MSVEIVNERPVAGGSEFDVQVIDSAGRMVRRSLRLGWADYNYWSPDGTDAPEQVAAAAIRFLLERTSIDSLPERIDASVARRMFADADEQIPRLIQR